MSYDMIKKNKDGEISEVDDATDDNYFRLNNNAINEVKLIAICYAAKLGAVSQEEFKKQIDFLEFMETVFSSGMTESWFVRCRNIISIIRDSEIETLPTPIDNLGFIEPFAANYQHASAEDCHKFGTYLNGGLTIIKNSPRFIVLEHDPNKPVPKDDVRLLVSYLELEGTLGVYLDFADWLLSAEHGIYVG